MGLRGNIITVAVLSMYITTVMGVGRYSCHCEHEYKIALWGITTKCSCTHEEHHHDPGNCCPCCGRHLVTKEIKKDDCCAAVFFMLRSDQNQTDDSPSLVLPDNTIMLTSFIPTFIIMPVSIPDIKTFQALFRQDTGPLYERHRQLIL